jgi:hypothetical protein
MDFSLLEYACGMGAWISLLILLITYFVAEEYEFYSTSLTKALLSLLVPVMIISCLYIVFEIAMFFARIILWILTLMIRPDIVGATFFIFLLSLVVITLNNVITLMNYDMMTRGGTIFISNTPIQEVE